MQKKLNVIFKDSICKVTVKGLFAFQVNNKHILNPPNLNSELNCKAVNLGIMTILLAVHY